MRPGIRASSRRAQTARTRRCVASSIVDPNCMTTARSPSGDRSMNRGAGEAVPRLRRVWATTSAGATDHCPAWRAAAACALLALGACNRPDRPPVEDSLGTLPAPPDPALSRFNVPLDYDFTPVLALVERGGW